MPKISKKYLEVDPYKIIELDFHADKSMESESIFSLGNEYCGIRGFFEEGYSGKSLIGTYFNGIYEYALSDTPNAYKGIVKRTHFTINSVNFLKCKIYTSNEVLDLANVKYSSFKRSLDMLTGEMERSFTWNTVEANIEVKFSRLLNMMHPEEALQKISFKSDKDIKITIELSLDSNILHWGSDNYWKQNKEFKNGRILGLNTETISTNQKISSLMYIDRKIDKVVKKPKEITAIINLDLIKDKKEEITRFVVNHVDKFNKTSFDALNETATLQIESLVKKGYDESLEENRIFFNNIWETSDIEIGGDDLNQQGIRYCIFQLAQTYHGYAKDNNIGAKGLTGEAYSGHAFWDSETYCLPYYLFSNKEAALNLLMFRYNTLSEAKMRAIDLDCEGACYPIATRNGKEGCNLWQHASLQFQPSTGVFYAIAHYMNIYNDIEFMKKYGLEMIIEIAKFLLSRGQYNQDRTKFGFYNVMGPDEFQMMVNHNTYTNFMAKKVFDYLIDIIDNKKYDCDKILDKCGFTNNHYNLMVDASNKMVILFDNKTKLYEQHEGFFDLPHLDINSIPEADFPLYANWSYDRIYRNDMIKQPDVLMFMFLYSQDFNIEEKKANYEYYEPRCIHESSLSPSIHSIFATELKKYDEAYKFFGFATRLDLDDYNCNTKEGIHTTSIAAAWMNIVYGFGGLRSDRSKLVLNPMIIPNWNYYSFKIKYHDSLIKVKVTKENVEISIKGNSVTLNIYGTDYVIKDSLVLENINA